MKAEVEPLWIYRVFCFKIMINLHTDILDKLNGNELALFCQIIRHIDKSNTCFPSRHRLAELTGFSREKVSKAINGLIEKKVIKTHQTKEGGKFSKTVYTITTNKAGIFINLSGESLVDHRDTENRTTEKPFAEKPTLSINHTLSINQSNYSDKYFLEDWNALRTKYLNKPSNANRLTNYERNLFLGVKSQNDRESVRNALIALFKQEVIKFSAMQSRPKHVLENFDLYLTAYQDRDTGLYGKKKKVSTL